MKVTILAATSLDGFIATEDGKTDWVKDLELFEEDSKAADAVVMGNRTFKEGDSIFEGVNYIVLSSKKPVLKIENVHFVKSPEEAVKQAEKLGFKNLLVAGGAQTNEAFARAGLVDKLVIDIHSLQLGNGKKLFGEFNEQLKIKNTKHEAHEEGFTRMEFDIKKSADKKPATKKTSVRKSTKK